MIRNESAIHSDSISAHTLLHIHLERMAVLSQLEGHKHDRRPSQRIFSPGTNHGYRFGRWLLFILASLLVCGVTRA